MQRASAHPFRRPTLSFIQCYNAIRMGIGVPCVSNRLYYGDNLSVLREHIADESVDLIYLDPPFNSNATYNILFKSPAGKSAEAQIEAFEDTWHWGEESERAFRQVLASANTDAAQLLRAMRGFLGENDMMAYLANMAVRLLELHRALKPTGSLYLHCDPTASHYLKLLLDAVFGFKGYRSEISWKRSSAHSDAKQGRRIYGSIRDVIFFYSKSDHWTWNWQFTSYDPDYIETFYRHREKDSDRLYRNDNLTAAKPGGDVSYDWPVKQSPDGNWTGDITEEFKNPRQGWTYDVARPYKGRYWAYSKAKMIAFEKEGRLSYTKTGMPNYKRYLDEMPGVPLQNDWQDIPPVLGRQDLGYPTQKPLALLERILIASSNAGEVVLDPFCGCGTAMHAAQKLGREWIGIDVTALAIGLIERRLKDAFPDVVFDIHGTPKTLEDALHLANLDKYQFQWWAVGLIGARPYAGKKKGADRGIDGVFFFSPDGKKSEMGVVSVKGGANVGVAAVRDLHSVMEREKAPIGVLIVVSLPTRAMEKEAAATGFYKCDAGEFPRLQIITLAELFQGRRPRIPLGNMGGTFRTAAREKINKQSLLDL